MPRPCSICVHPGREEIDSALLEGESFRILAERFETSNSTLFRHQGKHLSERLVQSHAAAEISKADDLVMHSPL